MRGSRWIERDASLATELLLRLLRDELNHARLKHPQPFVDPHHALGVLLEEVRELETEVFKRKPSKERLRDELLQIAAVALRAIEDVTLKLGTSNSQLSTLP